MATVSQPTAAVSNRLVSLDAFRGFIMLAMASAGFRLVEIARQVPSLATMIFGLIAGGMMRNAWPSGKKLAVLFAWGAVSLAAGYLLDRTGACPSVKRIWTPSWALFSTGWVLWMLAGFYALIDMAGFRRLAWPLVVVGMNSIVMYVMSQLLKGWVIGTLKRHCGEGIFTAYGHIDPAITPATQMVGVLVVFWLICVWLYRQKIFVRI